MNQLTADSVLSDEVLSEVFGQDDELYKARLLLSLEDRASELGVKRKFGELVKTYKKIDRENKRLQREREKQKTVSILENWTNFSDDKYPRMMCKNWIATDGGIYISNPNPGAPDILACYHPILPIKRLQNIQTDEEKIVLAFKRNGKWKEITVPKETIASNSKIVSLSKRSVAVTSENAKFLVKYLADVENANEDEIELQLSSEKLGWIEDCFLPYDNEIFFDSETEFRQVFNSIKPCGDREKWYECMKKIRASSCFEVKMMMAASFASVLVSKVDGLSFFVDLFGETEGGKTVTLMIATSIWADPSENKYMGNFKSTDTAIGVKANVLNNLPLIMDDTSNASEKIRNSFEDWVYLFCSGKGKSRSNKELGITPEMSWKMIVITSGEYSMQSYMSQAGAYNRILEVEARRSFFQNPREVVEVVKNNYGFAGKDFIEAIRKIGDSEIMSLYEFFLKRIPSAGKMQKQINALAIVLTADKIATDYLFKDGEYVSMDESVKTLTERNDLSNNNRCYQYVRDKVFMNEQKFDSDTHCEKWGFIDSESGNPAKKVVIFHKEALKSICREGGFSVFPFLKWLKERDLLICDAGRLDKQYRINGSRPRCFFMKLEEYDETDREQYDDDGVNFD